MSEVSTNELKRAVESRHGCTATLVQSAPVKETFDGKTVWDGIVHVFRIDGHPQARKAYAWSSQSMEAISAGFSLCFICRQLRRHWRLYGQLSMRSEGLKDTTRNKLATTPRIDES
jgi:hypothetical protein